MLKYVCMVMVVASLCGCGEMKTEPLSVHQMHVEFKVQKVTEVIRDKDFDKIAFITTEEFLIPILCQDADIAPGEMVEIGQLRVDAKERQILEHFARRAVTKKKLWVVGTVLSAVALEDGRFHAVIRFDDNGVQTEVDAISVDPVQEGAKVNLTQVNVHVEGVDTKFTYLATAKKD